MAAAARGRAIRAAGLALANDEHFGIRAAGAGQPGRAPPVVLLGQVEDALGRHAAAAPQVVALGVPRGMLVPFEHAEGQAVGVDAQPLGRGEELPAPGNHFLFEIVPQAPVAQHLKEGKVAGVAHVVNVAGANALLHVDQPLPGRVLLPHQVGHQRVHARGGKQHRRVILGDDRGRGDDGVPLGHKKLKEQLS